MSCQLVVNEIKKVVLLDGEGVQEAVQISKCCGKECRGTCHSFIPSEESALSQYSLRIAPSLRFP